MSIESKDWRIYERKIHQELSEVYEDCDFEFDDRVFGKYSKIDRQVDISIRSTVGGNKIFGIVDCKYFSKNIDVKIVESFLGMIEDVKANFGLIITNKGFSEAAKNRVKLKKINLEIVEFNKLKDIEITIDYLINRNIKNLDLSKYEFFKRCKQNWGYFDEIKSSYEKRRITFKEGFVKSEYYAFKKIRESGARVFRDFSDLSEITIRIPLIVQDTSSGLRKEKRMYYATIDKGELEVFLKIKFEDLKDDINKWRIDFIDNPKYTKKHILEFAKRYVLVKKI